MTSIVMGFFPANMERKLQILFAPLCQWSLDFDFDLGELIIFPCIPDPTVVQQELIKASCTGHQD